VSAPFQRARAARIGRYVLGTVYVAYFVQSYRSKGFPFDRERVLLWIAGALFVTSVGRGWRWALSVAIDWVPFAVLLFVYDYSYGFAKGSGRSVVVAPLVRADRLLFGGHVPAEWLQHHIGHSGPVHWWEVGVAVIYASHFVVPFALAGAFWWRSRHLWRRWVARFLTVSFSSALIYAVIPTGAPWYAADRGLITNLDRPVARGWTKIGFYAAPALYQRGRNLINPYAALPSLHAAFSFLVAQFVFQLIGKGKLRLLVFLYPAAMAFTLLYGGEHFAVDILAGWLLAALAALVCDRITRRMARRRQRAGATTMTESATVVPAEAIERPDELAAVSTQHTS